MPVVKTTSPTAWAAAPQASPSKRVPSSSRTNADVIAGGLRAAPTSISGDMGFVLRSSQALTSGRRHQLKRSLPPRDRSGGDGQQHLAALRLAGEDTVVRPALPAVL